VAHAVKGGDGEEEMDVNAAAALPCAVAPVGAPNVYYFGGAEGSKGSDGQEDNDGDAAAAFPHAVAPMGAPSVYLCGGADERR
jgi:hypothetical protein